MTAFFRQWQPVKTQGKAVKPMTSVLAHRARSGCRSSWAFPSSPASSSARPRTHSLAHQPEQNTQAGMLSSAAPRGIPLCLTASSKVAQNSSSGACLGLCSSWMICGCPIQCPGGVSSWLVEWLQLYRGRYVPTGSRPGRKWTRVQRYCKCGYITRLETAAPAGSRSS